MTGEMVVARARAAIGARFRLHGRDPAYGLDCVGLAAWALERDDAPRGYALRNGDVTRLEAAIARLGLCRGNGIVPGDLLVMKSGPGQLHLGIRSATGVIHADAMLRRVAERPGAPAWPVVSAWRVTTSEGA